MILGFHVILSAHGFWLPNDPRGSWSDMVRAWELRKFGPATKVTGRRSYAHDPHDVSLRRAAKTALKYPVVRLDEAQRLAIGAGFGVAWNQGNYPCLACCVGFDHAHVVLGRHDRDIHTIVGHLKSSATRVLTERSLHLLAGHMGKRGGLPTPWSAGSWSVFVNDSEQLSEAMSYVRRHPMKEGLPAQEWDFVGVRR